jgi:hypothetical protein
MMDLTQQIFEQIDKYVTSLDWAYIWTFIIIGYGMNHYKISQTLKKATKVSSKTRYKMAIIGLVYGIALYFIRGYDISHVEILFQSFVFALVFHKLFVDGLIGFVSKRILPEKIGKHFVKPEKPNNEA